MKQVIWIFASSFNSKNMIAVQLQGKFKQWILCLQITSWSLLKQYVGKNTDDSVIYLNVYSTLQLLSSSIYSIHKIKYNLYIKKLEINVLLFEPD